MFCFSEAWKNINICLSVAAASKIFFFSEFKIGWIERISLLIVMTYECTDYFLRHLLEVESTGSITVHWSHWLHKMIFTFKEDVGALQRLVATLLQLKRPVNRTQQEQTLVADGLYHGNRNLPSIKAKIEKVRIKCLSGCACVFVFFKSFYLFD